MFSFESDKMTAKLLLFIRHSQIVHQVASFLLFMPHSKIAYQTKQLFYMKSFDWMFSLKSDKMSGA